MFTAGFAGKAAETAKRTRVLRCVAKYPSEVITEVILGQVTIQSIMLRERLEKP
jgi:hypothetical protein